jgi:hypothetical protein
VLLVLMERPSVLHAVLENFLKQRLRSVPLATREGTVIRQVKQAAYCANLVAHSLLVGYRTVQLVGPVYLILDA